MATDSGLYIFYGLNPRHDTLFYIPRLRRGGGCFTKSHVKDVRQRRHILLANEL